LFRLGKVGIISDPVWNEVVGPPIITNFMGPRRLVDPPARVSELLPLFDIVLISHSHYDHLDLDTARLIGNSKLWIVPLGIKAILSSIGISNCIELNWWDSYKTYVKGEIVEITLTPAKHWSARSFYDRNTSLWGSFVMSCNGEKMFFAGDTAYCPVFKQIGEKFGPFNFSAIPIGTSPFLVLKCLL
jgi:N-acyl-phosphatidylethanolamine-hydrolysing phospholipase D